MELEPLELLESNDSYRLRSIEVFVTLSLFVSFSVSKMALDCPGLEAVMHLDPLGILGGI